MNDNNSLILTLSQRSLFANDVIHGLSKSAKTLPCKWFYDVAGSELFEQITETPEYYLTRVETRLLFDLTRELVDYIPNLSLIIELGSGSSQKTRILLESQPNLSEYIPIDISADFLHTSAVALRIDFPNLKITPVVCDFAALTKPLDINKKHEYLIFFPGSTIGNFNAIEAKNLLKSIRALAGKACWLLIGVDMTQDTNQLLAAYNDKAGITAKFNKNILARINDELAANFDLEKFQHRAIFNQDEHRIEMHLVSAAEQNVELNGQSFHFGKNEFIHTENSHKYPKAKFELLAHDAGWQISHIWEDAEESRFGVYLLKSTF
jgi:dimethylhistidine N-methyltransferase